jgi:hypothetical protein
MDLQSAPFQGRKYVGGYYRTLAGRAPTLTDCGWQLPLELGGGQAVFVGVDAAIASPDRVVLGSD